MAGPAQHNLRGARRHTRMLISVLAVAILVPTGILFVAHWRDVADQRQFALQEQEGIEYGLALGQVAATLTLAQSAAVTGEPIPQDDLTIVLENADAADRQFGRALRASERWGALREQIVAVTSTEHADQLAAFTAYGEVIDLLLDLNAKVRESSGLIRDPDPDVYYLQDGALKVLPEAMVAAGRLADLVIISAGPAGGDPADQNAEISAARLAVTGPANDLSTNLQAALDNTRSRTLSSRVLSSHDLFLRQKDNLLNTVPPDGRLAGVYPDRVQGNWQQLHTAAHLLLGALLAEMDTAIEVRADDLAARQRNAFLTLVAAIALVVGLLWVNLDRPGWPVRRWAPQAAAGATDPPAVPPAPAFSTPAGAEARWERSGAR